MGAYFHGLAIIQDSMECNLGISLMAIMKMIMFHYSYICKLWQICGWEECTYHAYGIHKNWSLHHAQIWIIPIVFISIELKLLNKF